MWWGSRRNGGSKINCRKGIEDGGDGLPSCAVCQIGRTFPGESTQGGAQMNADNPLAQANDAFALCKQGRALGVSARWNVVEMDQSKMVGRSALNAN